MILITRPIEQALETQHELEAMGFGSVIYPLLEIRHVLEFTLENKDFDAVIITSQNSAKIVRNASFLKEKPMFLVGQESANILREHKIECVAQDAKNLIKLIKKSDYKNFLYLCGDHISSKIDEILGKKGFVVEKKVVYNSVAVGHIPANILEYVTAVLFYSARTAKTFAGLIGSRNLSRVTALCISEKTAKEIRHLNWKSVKVAEKPDEISLLCLLN